MSALALVDDRATRPTPRPRRGPAPVVRSRVHGGVAVRSRAAVAVRHAHPLVRVTRGVQVDAPPRLRVVPRRRAAARIVVGVSLAVGALMAAAAAFQIQLAQRQLQLDRLDRAISDNQTQYQLMRRERAELRSPARLVAIASQYGMRQSSATKLMAISPEVLAEVQRSAGLVAREAPGTGDTPLEDFQFVKSVTNGPS